MFVVVVAGLAYDINVCSVRVCKHVCTQARVCKDHSPCGSQHRAALSNRSARGMVGEYPKTISDGVVRHPAAHQRACKGSRGVSCTFKLARELESGAMCVCVCVFVHTLMFICALAQVIQALVL